MSGLGATFGSGAMTNPLEDLRSANVIFVIGSNTTEQHPLAAERILDAKKNRGATLIVADPRRTILASMADLHLPLKPGSDIALIHAMSRVILDEGLENGEFIDKRTENFEAFRDSLAGDALAQGAAASGLPVEDIMRAARLYAAGPDSSIVYCMGVTQHGAGTANCLSLANLVMLCGMVGRPSTGLNPLRGQNNVQGSSDMAALPNVLPGYAPAGDPAAAARFEPIWGPFAYAPGITLIEMLERAGRGLVRGLYIVGENPAVSDADSTHVRHALESLDFLVVQDIFLTETAAFADVVLPAASWLEKEGTFTNTERRVQKITPVLEPLDGTLPDWRIVTLLLQRFGHKAGYTTPEDIFNELRFLVPSYAGMTYERIVAERGLFWPCPEEGHPGTPCLHIGRFTRGRGRFAAETASVSPEAPDKEYPLMLTTGRLGFHYHTGSMTRRAWLLDREFPEAFVEIHPEDAKNIGIKDGWTVRVTSRRGSVKLMAKVTATVRKGVVFMPFHFAESPANRLTGASVDPFTQTPAFKASAVRIEEA